MTSTKSAPVSHPSSLSQGLDLDEAYEQAQKGEGLPWDHMPYGEPGRLVRRYGDARFVPGDRRFSQISNFVLDLLEQPDRPALLRDRPDLLDNAVEELTRFVPLGSQAGFPRYATEDVEVGGTLVRAGEPVLIQMNAADRDAVRLRSPGVLDITRDDTHQHLGYGHGPHHCPGTSLARLELQEALRTLLDGLPGPHLAQAVEWKTEMVVRGPRTMLVGW
nr:cytochrome P450 [Streptomyces sp. NWU49]